MSPPAVPGALKLGRGNDRGHDARRAVLVTPAAMAVVLVVHVFAQHFAVGVKNTHVSMGFPGSFLVVVLELNRHVCTDERCNERVDAGWVVVPPSSLWAQEKHGSRQGVPRAIIIQAGFRATQTITKIRKRGMGVLEHGRYNAQPGSTQRLRPWLARTTGVAYVRSCKEKTRGRPALCPRPLWTRAAH